MRDRRDLKKLNSNDRQNRLPINLDDNKHRTRERCRADIRSELKIKPHENPRACSLRGQFYKWKWTVTLKENE